MTKELYFDLKGLSKYSTISVRTLRDYIKNNELPCFKVGGKILVKRSEFDQWMEQFRVKKGQDLDMIVDDIIKNLKK